MSRAVASQRRIDQQGGGDTDEQAFAEVTSAEVTSTEVTSSLSFSPGNAFAQESAPWFTGMLAQGVVRLCCAESVASTAAAASTATAASAAASALCGAGVKCLNTLMHGAPSVWRRAAEAECKVAVLRMVAERAKAGRDCRPLDRWIVHMQVNLVELLC